MPESTIHSNLISLDEDSNYYTILTLNCDINSAIVQQHISRNIFGSNDN